MFRCSPAKPLSSLKGSFVDVSKEARALSTGKSVQLILVSKIALQCVFLSLAGVKKNISVHILWDNRPLESCIVVSGLLFPSDTDTGDFVLGRRMRMMVLPLPLQKVCVSSDLVNGEVALAP